MQLFGDPLARLTFCLKTADLLGVTARPLCSDKPIAFVCMADLKNWDLLVHPFLHLKNASMPSKVQAGMAVW
jgi:hypothetical protein